MLYSYTALALALATVTQVTAQPSRHAARHGHAAFHVKKDAGLPEEEKRDVDWEAAVSNVDWNSALADVDWATVDYTYSAGQTWGKSTAAVVAAPATTSVITYATPEPVAAVQVTSAVVVPTTTEAPPTTLATSTSSVVAPTATKSASTSSNIVSSILSDVQELALKAFGVCSAGTNALSSAADVWIGSDGDYTMEIVNSASEDIYLVVWGPSGSWVNVNTPLVTLFLPPGSSKILSFANGASGAFSALYSDTALVNGQLSNTWVEFTMSVEGVFDVSKEVNMNGHDVEVVGPQCTSNMSTCVFQCVGDVSSCEYNYELVNCANGSQSGATFGTYDGADSGGCGGLGSSAAMTATFT